MQNEWSSPSGSRWEPAPSPGIGALIASDADPATTHAAEARGSGRSRRWLAAGLLTLLGAAGVATAGAAYVQGERGEQATPSGQASSQVAGGDERGGRHARGADGQRPDGVPGRGPRTGDGTSDGDEPALPSGNPS